MLKKIKLHNFMSYADITVSLTDARVALIVGDVGSGKSALLESILYVLYGYLRVSSVAEAITLTSETKDMYVKLLFKLPDDDSVYKVTRGRRVSGTGYCIVEKDGKLQAKGRVSKEYIEKLLGMNESIFKLTSFFGVGEADELMEALPSQRLETLQKVAKVDKYNTYFNIVAGKLSECDSRLGALKELLIIESVDFAKEIDKVKTELIEKQDSYSQITYKMQELFKRRDLLLVETKTAKTLSEELISLDLSLSSNERNLSKIKRVLENLSTEKKDCTAMINQYKTAIEKKTLLLDKDIENTITKREQLYEEMNYSVFHRDLLKMGISVSTKGHDLNRCPLCSEVLGKQAIADWKVKLDNLTTDIDFQTMEVVECDEKIERHNSVEKSIASVKSQLERKTFELRSTEEKISEGAKESKSVQSKLEKDLTRYDKVKSLLSPLNAISDGLNQVYEKLQEYQKKVGAFQEQIKSLESKLKQLKNEKSQYLNYKKEFSALRGRIKALTLLKRAYSRYGIPLDLTQNLVVCIQDEATKLYQYFDDGRVSIVEKEDRGLPGLDFALIDVMGRRGYRQLSKGQRALLSLSIRLAVSLILRRELNIKVDFLVLDEIASHLDPVRRDSLVKTACVILKKHYKQIFMVSHVKLKDVFSNVYKATLKDGRSELEVL